MIKYIYKFKLEKKMSIQIGDVILKHGLMLAPMAGFTDYSFRKICKDQGAEYTVSEMVSAKALCYEQRSKKAVLSDSKTAPLAAVSPEENPMAIQLFGSEPEFVAEAAAMIESREYRSCISKAVCGRGEDLPQVPVVFHMIFQAGFRKTDTKKNRNISHIKGLLADIFLSILHSV